MEEELLENETPKNEEETTTPEGGEPEKVDKSKDLQSALAQKEHFREKVEKLQKEVEGLKNNPPKVPSLKTNEKVEEWKASEDPLAIVKLTKVLKDYNEDETEFILKNAPSRDIEGIAEAIKNPYVQSAIQAMREKVASEQATPEPSGVNSGKFKIKSAEEIETMTPQQRREYAEEFMRYKAKGSGV
jgi:hypothetical protein